MNEKISELRAIASRNGRALYQDPTHPDRVTTYFYPDCCAMFTGSISEVTQYEQEDRQNGTKGAGKHGR